LVLACQDNGAVGPFECLEWQEPAGAKVMLGERSEESVQSASKTGERLENSFCRIQIVKTPDPGSTMSKMPSKSLLKWVHLKCLARIVVLLVPTLALAHLLRDGCGCHFCRPRSMEQRGASLKEDQSILVAQDHNEAKANACFKDFGLEFVTGSCFLGGFIGNEADQMGQEESPIVG
jgi:hypothetical protein